MKPPYVSVASGRGKARLFKMEETAVAGLAERLFRHFVAPDAYPPPSIAECFRDFPLPRDAWARIWKLVDGRRKTYVDVVLPGGWTLAAVWSAGSRRGSWKLDGKKVCDAQWLNPCRPG